MLDQTEPGTIFCVFCRTSLDGEKEELYQHLKIDHSIHFYKDLVSVFADIMTSLVVLANITPIGILITNNTNTLSFIIDKVTLFLIAIDMIFMGLATSKSFKN